MVVVKVEVVTEVATVVEDLEAAREEEATVGVRAEEVTEVEGLVAGARAALAEKVPASLWRVVWSELHDRIGLVGDPQTKDPARIFYLPQHAPDQPFEFHEGHGQLLDSSFRLDVEPVVNPVSPRSKQVRQPRQRRAGSEVLDEAWWNAPVDISRWGGLSGKALYSAMLDEFVALRNGLSVIE